MAILSMFAFFGSFALAMVLSQVHASLRTPTWLVAALTPAFVAIYWLAMKAMPFAGFVTELPLALLAAVAVSGPIAILNRTNEEIQAKQKAVKEGHVAEFRDAAGSRKPGIPLSGVLCLGLFLPTAAITIFSLVSRINYACWLQWECDGRIVLVTSDKGNHGNPMILVETRGQTEKFSPVDGAFWSAAKEGMPLRKSPGSPTALLDGRPVRMVPKQVEFWRDPK